MGVEGDTLALPSAHGRACGAISADPHLIPSCAPSGFLGPSHYLPPRLELVTLQVASVSSRLCLHSTWVHSVVLPGIWAPDPSLPQPRPQQPLATRASLESSSCLTALRTSSEEAPLDSSASPGGSCGPPGSPRSDTLAAAARLSLLWSCLGRRAQTPLRPFRCTAHREHQPGLGGYVPPAGLELYVLPTLPHLILATSQWQRCKTNGPITKNRTKPRKRRSLKEDVQMATRHRES